MTDTVEQLDTATDSGKSGGAAATPTKQGYCQHCDYILDLDGPPRCPECGEAFDPTDDDLTRPGSPRGLALSRNVTRLATSFPVLLLLSAHILWFVSYVAYGNVSPPVHDAAGVVGVGYVILSVLTYTLVHAMGMAFPVAVVFGLITLMLACFHHGRQAARSVRVVGICGVIWLGTIVYLRWDPLQVIAWMD